MDKTYNIYLDQYGNFIGAELYSGKDQYVFITGYDRPESSIAVSVSANDKMKENAEEKM